MSLPLIREKVKRGAITENKKKDLTKSSSTLLVDEEALSLLFFIFLSPLSLQSLFAGERFGMVQQHLQRDGIQWFRPVTSSPRYSSPLKERGSPPKTIEFARLTTDKRSTKRAANNPASTSCKVTYWPIKRGLEYWRVMFWHSITIFPMVKYPLFERFYSSECWRMAVSVWPGRC